MQKLNNKKSAISNKIKIAFPISPGHTACAGCGELLAIRTAMAALGPNVIVANSTGCSEVTTTQYPMSSWGMPWIHSLFENAPAVASGILAALKSKKKKGVKIIAQGGDGATFDIGLGLLSGMWERGEDILYICYDNEAYANTGIQASGATPYGADTTTTPAGKCAETSICSCGSMQRKKDMLKIALAHNLNYVAQTTAGFPSDIEQKIKKAIATPGPAYIQIAVPCVPGWKIEPNKTVKIAKLAAQTGIYPAIEYINGELTSALKIPRPQKKVEEYLKLQGRFSHLFKNSAGKKQIQNIQKIADENIKKYNL
jgi:pyruvate ferredoxin oxidoreductase beta subunit